MSLVARATRPLVTVTPLEQDSGCCNRLNWRCSVIGEVDDARLERRLTARGLRTRCRHPALQVFRHPKGHEIAWVKTTGRIQIRVDIEMPLVDREPTARALHRSLFGGIACMTEGDPVPVQPCREEAR